MSRVLILLFATILVSCGTKKENLIPALSETERAAAEKLGKSIVEIGFGSLSTKLKTQFPLRVWTVQFTHVNLRQIQ